MNNLQANHNNGFIVVASQKKPYITSACILAGSIRDHYPDAQITLFATSDIIDGCDLRDFSQVITQGVPDDRRAKLWALSHTPYAVTAYLDADTIVVSDEVRGIFDQIKQYDLVFTKIRAYNSNPKGYLDDPRYIHHGGVFVYRSSEKVLAFMRRWWKMWNTTRVSSVFKQTYPQFPEKMKEWDQFYLHYLIYYTDHNLNIGFFENDARWNFVRGYLRSELNGLSPIIEHYTLKI